jgi:hypothetical protein
MLAAPKHIPVEAAGEEESRGNEGIRCQCGIGGLELVLLAVMISNAV